MTALPLVGRTLLLLLLAGCAGEHAAAPPAVRSLALLPPVDRTGDALLVAGGSLLERYALNADRVTVGDVLASTLRAQLERRGIAVTVVAAETATDRRTPATLELAAETVRRAGLDEPTLFVTIDRWEPDNPTHPAFVIVAAKATLIEPATNRVLWHRHRNARPVATPGAATSGAAHAIAARTVAAELLDGWPAAPAAP